MIAFAEFDDDSETGISARYFQSGIIPGSDADTRDQDGEIAEHINGMMEE